MSPRMNPGDGYEVMIVKKVDDILNTELQRAQERVDDLKNLQKLLLDTPSLQIAMELAKRLKIGL